MRIRNQDQKAKSMGDPTGTTFKFNLIYEYTTCTNSSLPAHNENKKVMSSSIYEYTDSSPSSYRYLFDYARCRHKLIKPVLWVRIRMSIDSHSHGCPGSGSVLGMQIRIQEHGKRPNFTNKTVFLPFKKAFYIVLCMLFDRPITYFSLVCI
jgi:hypothetical protein